MKKYKQLIKELPSKSVVFAFGRFNPPTVGHELLIKVVRKIAQQHKADHIVFASATQDAKKNPLEVNKKVQYLELLFPNTRFAACTPEVRTFLEAAKTLNKKYKNLIMVAGSDRVKEFEKLLNQYNGKEYKFESIQVISAGERDPDSDDLSGMSASKMRSLASKGQYLQFKKGLPTTIRDIDGKRLMNDVRCGMGLEPIKEQINLVKDAIREKYFRGEIFNEGDIVESDNTVYTIIKRGSNHLLLQDETGAKVSKWVQDVQQTEREFMSQINEEDIKSGAKEAENIRKMAELKANQAKQIEDVKERQARETEQAKEANKRALANEAVDSPVVDPSKKYNIAKSIMRLSDFRKTMQMGQKPIKVDNDKETESDIDAAAHSTSSPTHTQVGGNHLGADGNHSLRRMKIGYHLGEGYDDNRTGFAKKPREDDEGHGKPAFKAKSMMDRPHTVHIDGKPWKKFDNGHQAHKAADTLTSQGKKAVAIAHFKEETEEQKDCHDDQLKRFKAQAKQAELDPVKEEFDDLDAMIDEAQLAADIETLSEEDILEAYDDEELAIIDEDTGEEIEAVAEESEFDTPMIMEVLSRQERIKAKARLRRTQAKRVRNEKIAIRRFSTPQVANRRARRMAVSVIKKRLLSGRAPSKASIGEKERAERFLAQRRKIVDRLAARMVQKVRAVEKKRLSHKKFTK